MANKRDEILALLQNDPLNLLKSPSHVKRSKEASVLLNGFEEIVDFFERKGREPESNCKNLQEFQLYARLQAIRLDATKKKFLKPFDFYNLLQGPTSKEMTIEDIISDDEFGLLDSDTSDIFDLKYVKQSERISPDCMSRRKFCKDFGYYKIMFETLQEELKTKKRKLVVYNPESLRPGNFYVLGGILLFFKDVEGKVESYEYESGERNRFDGRTTIIFENGTQSDMLYRSLDKALQKEGYGISEIYQEQETLEINEEDILNGFVYILKTKNLQLASYPDLYKIGFTTTTVPERIKNAKKQATYLFSEVEVVSVLRCFNVKSFAIEKLIHSFFDKVRLDIEVFDNHHEGNVYKPREWFLVDKDVIIEAVQLISQNILHEYIYDPVIKQILKID